MNQLALKIGEEFCLRELVGGTCQGISKSGPAYQSVGGFISAILPNIYVVAGVILFILLLAGGIMIIAGAGKGESESTKKGQQAISAALAGFLIIFASYWIMQIIETVTGIQIFKSGI